MAEFEPAFILMIELEGGHVLHEVEGDRGGQTYAGISRRHWPDWKGWNLIDRKADAGLTQAVRDFYRENFWSPCHLIDDQKVANCLFAFAVNAGKKTAFRLAQHISGSTPDGIPGPKTVGGINGMDPEIFLLRYYVAMVSRYTAIVRKSRGQLKFLPGWLRRAERTVL